MTSRQSQRYGPMLFDASDVTTLLRREGNGHTLNSQTTGRVKQADWMGQGQRLDAVIGSLYCAYTAGQFCTLPVVRARLGSGSSFPITTGLISLPSS
jgi:hypothetical protein